MRRAVRPGAAWALCLAVWLAQAVGLVHSTLHAPGWHAVHDAHSVEDASDARAGAAHGHAHISISLHDEGDATCLVLDGLGMGHPQADTLPLAQRLARTCAAGPCPAGCIAPFASSFDARGPPSRG